MFLKRVSVLFVILTISWSAAQSPTKIPLTGIIEGSIEEQGPQVPDGTTTFNCRPQLRPDQIDCNNLSQTFRTIDGTCNNLRNPTLGAIEAPLKRLLPPNYADNFDAPRGFPGTRPVLPPANQVSGELFKVETQSKGTGDLSVLYMTMGQFLDHDIALSPHASCNISDCSLPNAFEYPCIPILFENGLNTTCTPFARANPTCQDENGLQRPRNQINIITAYIDASQVYGSNAGFSKRLRRNDGSGKLLLIGEGKKGLLPLDNEINPCPVIGGCSLVGDERGDENIALHAMHTLWVREHNRIAEQLKSLNINLNEEELYQRSRKIVGGIMQHILYTEWIPKIANLPKYEGYNQFQHPGIANAFSTAAFRFGHSLVPNKFSQLDPNFDELFAPVTLQAAFLDRQLIDNRGIEPTMFGLIANRSSNIDNGFASALVRKLFIRPGEDGFVDLTAYNIARGRDHGLPTYGDWRRTCGLPPVRTLRQLRRAVLSGTAETFRSLFNNGDRIDLFPAGITEKAADGLIVGPTFACIIGDQFTRLRDGDRFYYEADGVFTQDQLIEIRKASMSRIMCDNLEGIVSIQPKAFEVPSETNIRINCERISRLDLSAFATST